MGSKKEISRLKWLKQFWLFFFGLLLITSCHSLRVERSDYVNIRIDSILTLPGDPVAESIIQPYRMKLSADMNEVLCRSAMALFGGRPESPLTNFCADLVLEESNIYLANTNPGMKIDVAMINRGGLRIPLPEGDILVKTLFELMPFENEIVFLKIKGDLLIRFVDHLASRGGEGVAGMRFGIRDGKAVSPEVHGQPIDPVKEYWLSTSDYIADGGDGSGVLTNATERIGTGIRVRDMFIGHLRKMGKENKMVEAKNDGRVYHVE